MYMYIHRYHPWLGKVRKMDTHHLLLSGKNCHTVGMANLGLECVQTFRHLIFRPRSHYNSLRSIDVHVAKGCVYRRGFRMLTLTYT